MIASLTITMIGNIGYFQESVASTSMLLKSSANMTTDSITIKTQAKKGFNDEFFPEEYTKRFGQKPTINLEEIDAQVIKKV